MSDKIFVYHIFSKEKYFENVRIFNNLQSRTQSYLIEAKWRINASMI